jgi:hypothetical protein
MALMLFRERNQARWIGTRPAHRGTQIAKYATAQNATVIVHTVTAGKTLFLVHAALMLTASGGGGFSFYIRDAADVDWFWLGAGYFPGGLVQEHHVFAPAFPLEVPAGYDIVAVSSVVANVAKASVFGWEE